MKAILMPILQACFNFEPNLRPTCKQLLQSVSQITHQLLSPNISHTGDVVIGGLTIDPTDERKEKLAKILTTKTEGPPRGLEELLEK